MLHTKLDAMLCVSDMFIAMKSFGDYILFMISRESNADSESEIYFHKRETFMLTMLKLLNDGKEEKRNNFQFLLESHP